MDEHQKFKNTAIENLKYKWEVKTIIYEDNAIRKVFHYPKRGYVYDRNGELLVANQPSYDVMIIPREVEPLDTIEFCSLLKISKEKFANIINALSRIGALQEMEEPPQQVAGRCCR